MKQIYCEKWSKVLGASSTLYIFSDRVKSGHVLHVKNCFGHSAQLEANDIAHIGIQNGGTKVIVRCKKCNLAGEGVSTINDFYVGEGDQVYAYFPDADTTDTIELHVTGVLMSRDEFK